MLFKRICFPPLIVSFSRLWTIIIISMLPTIVVSIMYYRLFCCSTVPYNNTERVSFVTSWTEQVNVTTVTTVRDDPCLFIFRPWLCNHNITDTRLVSYQITHETSELYQTDILYICRLYVTPTNFLGTPWKYFSFSF